MEHEFLKHMTTMDDASLRDIMAQYGSDIWNYAYFLTKNRELADDVTQDVFIKAYYRIETFRGQSSLKTWLLTITRNTAFRYRRSTFFRKVNLFASITSIQSGRSAETEYMEDRYVDDIWDVIMKLPDQYREVLVLDIRYELSTEEMAKLLNIATGTVKSRLHRAREKVEQNLKEVRS
ncbi:RNA polymerase sigma factor [Cohnella nanjingensis]|uniref:RNA polymerase sigma factor n=1 Tax=Cohnella nanjingensis TaxID=1387779 RepID=A0A7X0RPZ2_9BACL|nr:RNA polymerase sigma factor [Cohnella nanjingensis]